MTFTKTNLSLPMSIGLLIFAQFLNGCLAVNQSSSNGTSQVDAGNNQKDKSVSENAGNETPEICRNAYYPVGPKVTRKYHIDYPKNSFPANEFTEKLYGLYH